MADETDKTDEPQKRGGGFPGVVGAGVGAYAGALGASHLGTGERLVKKLDQAIATGLTAEAPKDTTKLVEQLTATKNIVAKEGILNHLKRPYDLIREGSSGRKLAIAGAAVALGAATYAGIRSYRNRDTGPQADTFAGTIDQQRAAAAADPSAGKSVG